MLTTDHFISREISWLAFNARVLGEAADKRNPLLERLKFLAIFSSNLDEFFMVRIAGLRQQIEAGSTRRDPAGNTPADQIEILNRRIRALVRRQYSLLNRELLPQLESQGILISRIEELPEDALGQLRDFFEREVMPILTPCAVDGSHPFPILGTGAIQILVSMRHPNHEEPLHAFVEVPTKVLSRFVEIDGGNGHGSAYILLEDVILAHLDQLLGDREVLHATPMRLTRDMDFDLNEEMAADLVAYLELQLRHRRRRAPIRLEIPPNACREHVNWLLEPEQLDLDTDAVFTVPGMLDLTDLWELVGREACPELTEERWLPAPVPEFVDGQSTFETIREHQTIPVLLPFQSFDPVVRFLEEAADDPNVLAIKQTLYRVSGDSPVVRSLRRAAENGKQVTVVVEVKARFDEERNIEWARRLEESGAHVIYGIAGLKIHCKALLIIRREEGAIRRYVHLGTGNYNDKTAALYTDIGVFFADPAICRDVAAMFNTITGYTDPPNWERLAVAPFDLRRRFLELIDRETRLSTPHNPGHIIAKMNALVDPEIIEHLYAAARAGVQVDLIVRGICCLKPGIDTDRIRIVSILDRYLEHTRLYYFQNAGHPEYYLASADWMPRNLDRRIECMFPVDDPRIQKILHTTLELQLKDRAKGRELKPSGRYTRSTKRPVETRSQYRTYQQVLALRDESRENGEDPKPLQILRGNGRRQSEPWDHRAPAPP